MMNKRTLAVLVSFSQLIILVLSDEMFPLRMPGIKPTKNEAYLCTGVEIGPDRRLSSNVEKNYLKRSFLDSGWPGFLLCRFQEDYNRPKSPKWSLVASHLPRYASSDWSIIGWSWWCRISGSVHHIIVAGCQKKPPRWRESLSVKAILKS